MEIIQVVIIIFAIFALSRAVLRFKDNKLSIGALAFWTVIWVGVIILAFSPTLLSSISLSLGIHRGVDLLVYLSIIILFYLLFRVYVQLATFERTITKLVRELALRKKRK